MKTVTIELTEEQAKLLSYVMSSIGGDPLYSTRKITNEIQEKLSDAGMHYTLETEKTYPIEDSASLWFCTSLYKV